MRRFLPRHVALAITDAHNPKTPPRSYIPSPIPKRQIPEAAQDDKFRCSAQSARAQHAVHHGKRAGRN